MESPYNSSSGSIRSALGRAILVWIALYVGVIHIMVGWKLTTTTTTTEMLTDKELSSAFLSESPSFELEIDIETQPPLFLPSESVLEQVRIERERQLEVKKEEKKQQRLLKELKQKKRLEAARLAALEARAVAKADRARLHQKQKEEARLLRREQKEQKRLEKLAKRPNRTALLEKLKAQRVPLEPETMVVNHTVVVTIEEPLDEIELREIQALQSQLIDSLQTARVAVIVNTSTNENETVKEKPSQGPLSSASSLQEIMRKRNNQLNQEHYQVFRHHNASINSTNTTTNNISSTTGSPFRYTPTFFVDKNNIHNDSSIIQQQTEQQEQVDEKLQELLYANSRWSSLERALSTLDHVSRAKPNLTLAVVDLDVALLEFEDAKKTMSSLISSSSSKGPTAPAILSALYWKSVQEWFVSKHDMLSNIDWNKSLPELNCSFVLDHGDKALESKSPYVTEEDVEAYFDHLRGLYLSNRQFHERPTDWPVSLHETMISLETSYTQLLDQTVEELDDLITSLMNETIAQALQAASNVSEAYLVNVTLELGVLKAQRKEAKSKQKVKLLEAQKSLSSSLKLSSSYNLSKSKSFADSCVSTESQVLPWLEAGLDAHYRHRDIRQSIVNAVKSDATAHAEELGLAGTDADSGTTIESDSNDSLMLILDAILPSDDGEGLLDGARLFASPDEDQRSKDRRTTLREILDKPLTYQAGKWMDQLIDQISGYNDRLDAVLDKLFAKYDKIGSEFVLPTILQQAGSISIPVSSSSSGTPTTNTVVTATPRKLLEHLSLLLQVATPNSATTSSTI